MRALVAFLFLAGCSRGFSPPSDSHALPIDDRQWDAEAPAEGWCGETSIQLAAGWYGAYAAQAKVNALGHPKTPDLWEYDVPVALEAMHLRFTRGPQTLVPALRWIVEELRREHPVVLGLKLVPTEHPEWAVDHLVLAVGFSPDGLLIDTNAEEGQITVSWAGLQRAEGDREYTLVNHTGEVFAFAVDGFEAQPTLPVRVRIVSQDTTSAVLDVSLTGMRAGATYELLRDETVIERFTAKGTSRSWRMEASPTELVRFSAREAPAR